MKIFSLFSRTDLIFIFLCFILLLIPGELHNGNPSTIHLHKPSYPLLSLATQPSHRINMHMHTHTQTTTTDNDNDDDDDKNNDKKQSIENISLWKL